MLASIEHVSSALDAAACRVCGQAQVEPWKERNLERPLEPDDLQITDSRYGVTLALVRCTNCGFVFAVDSELDQLTPLYEALEDRAYEQGEDFRALQMRWLLEHCRRARPEARTLLDVGAAAGLLVREAGGLGIDSVGVEPSHSLATAARSSGAEVFQGTLPHPALARRDFDIVTCIDVVEHVADPVGLLKDAVRTLAPSGILAIVTPDVGSLAARLLGARWWHFRLAHVCYFDRKSLDAALEAVGLRVIVRKRAKWFFKVGYLADRMNQYLPVSGLNRLLRSIPGVRALYDVTIPLDLRDSFFLLLERVDDRS